MLNEDATATSVPPETLSPGIPFAAPAPWRPIDWVLLTLILLLAAFLRFYGLTYMEFKHDEADNAGMARVIATGQAFPLVGIPNSIEGLNPPFFVYFMALPFLLSPDPIVGAAFIALLNVLGVGLAFALCREFLGRPAAVAGSLLLAVNIWCVFYSRKIWQQDALMPFAIGYIWLVLRLARDGRPRQLLGAMLIFGLMTQLHLSSLYLGLLVPAALLVRRTWVRWWVWLASLGLLLLLYAPYVAFDLQHRFLNLRTILRASTQEMPIQWGVPLVPIQVLSTREFPQSQPFPNFDALAWLALVLSLAWCVWRWRRVECLVLAGWLLLPVFFITVGNQPAQLHYLIMSYPAVPLLIGAGVARLAVWGSGRIHPRLPWILWGLTGAVALAHVVCNLTFVHYVRDGRNVAWLGYGPAYRYRVAEVRQAIAATGSRNPEVVHAWIFSRKQGASRMGYDLFTTTYLVRHANYLGYGWN